MPKEERLRLLKEENEFLNSLIVGLLPQQLVGQLPHFYQTWLRNYVATMFVYFGVCGAWCYYAYWCFGKELYKPGTIPAFKDVAEQMKVGR